LTNNLWTAENQRGVPSAPRCYAPERTLAVFIKQSSQPNMLRSLAAIASDHLVIIASGVVNFLVWQSGVLLLALAVIPIAWLITGRTMRGLECLVHEASHYNLSRKRRLNDALADYLCAWPVMSQVSHYRQSHIVHHRSFGHATDPDRIRSEKLNLSNIDRTTTSRFLLGILKRLLPYIPGWWWAIGVDRGTVARLVLWHGALVMAPATLVLGLADAAVFWLLTWGIPVFFVLPVVSFIAEAAEHDYDENGETQVIFKTTWSNIGWIHHWIFHPHNDGFHAVHHLYPSVPFHALPAVHKRLMDSDATFLDDALIRHSLVGDHAMQGRPA
jgi:fatty acid desaturase